MRAVVTIVVSIAEMNKHSHSPATIVCSLALLMLGTTDALIAELSVLIAVFSS